MKKDILYLASQSLSRKRLLEIAEIDYILLDHNSDEKGINPDQSFVNYVLDIAKHKMELAILPEGQSFSNGDHIYVLTADTLTRTTKTNTVLGKPTDIENARWMLSLLRDEEVYVVTGCCLERKIYHNGKWLLDKQKTFATESFVEFIVPEDEVDLYIEKVPHALKAACSGVVEAFGNNYFKSIKGSYTSVIGLPMFELRQALKELNFKF